MPLADLQIGILLPYRSKSTNKSKYLLRGQVRGQGQCTVNLTTAPQVAQPSDKAILPFHSEFQSGCLSAHSQSRSDSNRVLELTTLPHFSWYTLCTHLMHDFQYLKDQSQSKNVGPVQMIVITQTGSSFPSHSLDHSRASSASPMLVAASKYFEAGFRRSQSSWN